MTSQSTQMLADVQNLTINIKKINKEAVTPAYSKPGDAAVDLTAISVEKTDLYIEYSTGLSIEIPTNFVGLIFPRSSISNKELVLSNSVGVIDSGYRGEIKFRFKYNEKGVNPENFFYKVGDRVGQLMVIPYPRLVFNEVEELSITSRGNGGFGSTGK